MGVRLGEWSARAVIEHQLALGIGRLTDAGHDAGLLELFGQVLSGGAVVGQDVEVVVEVPVPGHLNFDAREGLLDQPLLLLGVGIAARADQDDGVAVLDPVLESPDDPGNGRVAHAVRARPDDDERDGLRPRVLDEQHAVPVGILGHATVEGLEEVFAGVAVTHGLLRVGVDGSGWGC